jgi:hypothetical protein
MDGRAWNMDRIKFIPTNEIQTREWFVDRLEEFDYIILESQAACPDWILSKNGDEIRAEVEYRSANFIQHKHKANECELVICWIHNSKLPLPVFELSTRLMFEPNECHEGAIERTYFYNKNTDKEILSALRNVQPLINSFLHSLAKELSVISNYTKELGEARSECLNSLMEIKRYISSNGLDGDNLTASSLLNLLGKIHNISDGR